MNIEVLNIDKVLTQYGIENTDELARWLFPTARYPEIAFRRVLKGETTLDSYQIAAVAHHLQVPISDLFTVEDTDWHATRKDKRLVFYKQDYKITVGGEAFAMQICKGKDLIYDHVGSISLMTIQDFLKLCDEKIKEFEQNLQMNQ